MNNQCGDGHFWMVNQPNTPVAEVSLRRTERAACQMLGYPSLASVGCSSSGFLIFVFWSKIYVSLKSWLIQVVIVDTSCSPLRS